MNIFHLFAKNNINQEIEKCRNTPGAVLLDVRSKEEYDSGHIPGSINIPVENIKDVEKHIINRETPVFVYCLRGTRSLKAVKVMQTLEYTQVKSIGGIASYKGQKIKSYGTTQK